MSSSIDEQLQALIGSKSLSAKTGTNNPKVDPEDQDDDDDQDDLDTGDDVNDGEEQTSSLPTDDDQDQQQDEDDEEQSAMEETAVSNPDRVLIYEDKCLKCTHLYSGAIKTFDKCHYTAGNDDCPASRTQILIGINFEKASEALADAMLSNNVERLTRISHKLADKDDYIKTRVFQMARDLIAKGSAIR